ncbi:hypothetical protein [Erythrobacter sp.]|uniref:restriction endonuclease subunit S n=1 Tax=Erythrobacter sp. TaxID=1042 RepID=UPI002EBC85B3|nr:hypothetical protein [Erythrobacter sp.]
MTEVTLADLVEPGRKICYGIVQPGAAHADGIPILRVNNFGANGLSTDDVLRIDPTIAQKYPRSKLHGGELLVTLVGSVGQVAIAPTKLSGWNVARAVGVVPIADPVMTKWVSYVLRSGPAQAFLGQRANTTVQTTVNLRDLALLPIPLLPRDELEAVIVVLSALDDKIELNRRMNETLEAQARALFHDWFVDFGPVKAKMAGDTPYLAPDLWSLFPDRLDDDGVPEGWLSQPLKQHIRVERGLSYKGSGLVEAGEGLPLHNLNSVIEGGGYKQHGLKHYDGDYKPRHRVEVGDVLVANTEQGFDHLLIGFSTLVPAWVGESIFSHHLYKVIPLEGSVLSRLWLHYALSSSPIGERIRRFSNGTTVNMLPKDAFEISEAVIPSEGLIKAFDDFVSSALRRSEKAEDENRTLAQTRDLLLPKLMSGEIRVGDVANEELSAA